MDPLIEDLVLTARKQAEKGEWQQVESLVAKIFVLKPTSLKGLQLHSFVLYQKGQFQEAANAISEVIEHCKPLLMNYEMLGSCYMRLKQYENAEKTYLEILEMEPENPNAHIELAYIYLISQKWEQGWNHYEFRYAKANQEYLRLFDKSKAWNGKESLKDKTIVLYCEQGYGDFIQFIRYVNRFDTTVYIEVQDELTPLLAKFGNLVRRPFNLQHDFHCSVASLPNFLNIPPEEYKDKIPYISAERFDLTEYRDNFKIGIAWTGSPLNPTQDHRSCTVEDFLQLIDIENVKLFSLQKDITLDSSHIIDMSSHMNDFMDTAKIVESMDMIITVDTCILHLAGAMNKECWGVMSYYADWRWGTEEKPIWYDSIRLFRQENPKDWATVFKKIKTELIGKLNVRKKALDAAAT